MKRKSIPKPRPTERRFDSPGYETSYVYAKIAYWLYVRHNRRAALRYCARFERLLRAHRYSRLSYFTKLHWGALCEAKGNPMAAVRHWREALRRIVYGYRFIVADPGRRKYLRERAKWCFDRLAENYRAIGRPRDVARIRKEQKQVLAELKSAPPPPAAAPEKAACQGEAVG